MSNLVGASKGKNAGFECNYFVPDNDNIVAIVPNLIVVDKGKWVAIDAECVIEVKKVMNQK